MLEGLPPASETMGGPASRPMNSPAPITRSSPAISAAVRTFCVDFPCRSPARLMAVRPTISRAAKIAEERLPNEKSCDA